MKEIGTYFILPLLLSLGFGHTSAQQPRTCSTTSRIAGIFGAENGATENISVSDGIRQQLPNLVAVRLVLDTNLSPSGEKVVVYDTSKDELDPQPYLAFVVQDKVVKTFITGEATEALGGFERFLAACQFPEDASVNAVALAISSAGDGAASAFAIFAWRAGQFKIIFHTRANQARLVLGQRQIALWTSEGGQCIWCPQRYRIQHYRLENGRYHQTTATETKKALDPADISSVSLILADQTGHR